MTSLASQLAKAADALANSSDSPVLDAEVLLCHVLGKPRSHLRTWPDKALTQEQADSFAAAVGKRQQGWPIAYITGVREFWSRDFIVTPDVLIPRPDTECLIELSLQLLPQDKPGKIIDLGTGSGIIAITLACERPSAKVYATDISAAALNIARLNADTHQAQVEFRLSDWFANVPENQFDLIVSNPPYIEANDKHLKTGDLRFEPQHALSSGEHGLDAIKTIASAARHYLKPGGHLLIEHGYRQSYAVQTLFQDHQYQAITSHKDLAGHLRVTCGTNSPNKSRKPN